MLDDDPRLRLPETPADQQGLAIATWSEPVEIHTSEPVEIPTCEPGEFADLIDSGPPGAQ